MKEPFIFPDDKNPFYSNAVADRMEEIIKQVASFHAQKRSDWMKEFVATILKKNKVEVIEQQIPAGRGYESRIVMDGVIISSFRNNGYETVEVWKNPEFYGEITPCLHPINFLLKSSEHVSFCSLCGASVQTT